MQTRLWMKWLSLISLLSLFLLTAENLVWAQGCPMCKNSIAGASNSAELAAKFNDGVLILLIPVMALFTTIIVVAYRNRHA
ncbi:MAG: hypothetical protein AB1489_07475 [Acidobacteriota bacterium]